MDLNEPSGLHIKSVSGFLCKILWMMGLWKPFQKETWLRNIYSSYSILMLSIFSILYTTLMVINIFFLTEISDLTDRIYISLTETALAIKIINFFFHNREWQESLTEIEEFRLKSLQEVDILRPRFRMNHILVYAYFLVVNIAIQGLAAISVISGGKNLIFSGWYPGFDWENNRRDFWIIFTYQYIGLTITANLNVTIDSYYSFVMHILSAQINIFGNRLSSMQLYKGLNDIRLILIQQMRTHQQLNTTFTLIQRNLQWAYFSQVLLSSIVICSVTQGVAQVNKHLYLSHFPLNFLDFESKFRII